MPQNDSIRIQKVSRGVFHSCSCCSLQVWSVHEEVRAVCGQWTGSSVSESFTDYLYRIVSRKRFDYFWCDLWATAMWHIRYTLFHSEVVTCKRSCWEYIPCNGRGVGFIMRRRIGCISSLLWSKTTTPEHTHTQMEKDKRVTHTIHGSFNNKAEAREGVEQRRNREGNIDELDRRWSREEWGDRYYTQTERSRNDHENDGGGDTFACGGDAEYKRVINVVCGC